MEYWPLEDYETQVPMIRAPLCSNTHLLSTEPQIAWVDRRADRYSSSTYSWERIGTRSRGAGGDMEELMSESEVRQLEGYNYTSTAYF